MIYTASYFSPSAHHGALVPISRSVPTQYKGLDGNHPLQPLLAPSADLLKWWKKQEKRYKEMGWEFPGDEIIGEYTSRYREEIRANKDEILKYLLQVDLSKDETWLCWEKPGEFCHRNLAYELAAKVRPDCVGGKDIEVIKTVEVDAPKCYFEVGDRVTLINTKTTGIVLEILPEREGAFPQALGVESHTKIQLEGAIAWWKTIQLRSV